MQENRGDVRTMATTRRTTMRGDALADDCLARLRQMFAVIRAFKRLRPTMPLQYMEAFVLVALSEGKSVSEYAQAAGVSISVMSRHLQDIGDMRRDRSDGFGLVYSRPSPMELRKHEVWLTPVGRALAMEIATYLSGANKP